VLPASDRHLAAALDADGGLFATGNEAGDVCLWDTASGQPVRVLSGHQAAVTAVAFAPAGGVLAAGSADGTVCLWELATGTAAR